MNLFRNLFTLKNCDDEKSREELHTYVRFSNFSTEIIFTKKSNRLFILSHVFSKAFQFSTKSKPQGIESPYLVLRTVLAILALKLKCIANYFSFLGPKRPFQKRRLLLWYFFSTKAFLHRAIRYFCHNTLNFVPLLLLQSSLRGCCILRSRT